MARLWTDKHHCKTPPCKNHVQHGGWHVQFFWAPGEANVICVRNPQPHFVCGHINPPIWTTTKSKCSTICGLMPHRQATCVTKGNALSIYNPLSETVFKTSQTAVSHVTRCSKHYSTPSIIPRIHMLIPFPEKKHQKPWFNRFLFT